MRMADARRDPGARPPRAVWERGAFEVARIDEIERETKHDVIAFLTNVAEHVGPEARFLHQGMTSSDVLDTCLAVQLAPRRRLLLADIDARARGAQSAAPSSIKRHAVHRPQPRHPRRADDLRAEACRLPCRVATQPRRGWPRRAPRSPPAPSPAPSAPSPTSIRASKRMSRRKLGLAVEPVLDAGDPARPARDVLRDARGHRQLDRTPCPAKSATCSEPRCGRPRSTSRRARRARRRCRTSATRSSPRT